MYAKLNRLAALLAAACLFASCKSVPLPLKLEALPEFTEETNAFVFELPDGVTDNIVFRNMSDRSYFGIKLYAFAENQKWTLAGTGFLKGMGDRDTTDSFDGKFHTARYYAAVPTLPDSFAYEIYETNSDLNILLCD